MKHQAIYGVLRPLVAVFLRWKFGYTYEVTKNLPDTYIVLSNHTTDYDPLFVAASFPKFMHFVASEHVARWKWLSSLLSFAFAPIWRYKGSVAASTVIEVFKKIKGKTSVCIFAEGARSWDGVTATILPSTGKVIKKANCALVTYKIVGGYFASPNWSTNNTRKGYVHGAPVNIYTKEQLADMTIDEINEIIRRDLYEDAYARQLQTPRKYVGKNLAESAENLLFICPNCGEQDTISSKGNAVSCKKCDYHFTYNEYGMLEGTDFQTMRELADWEREEVRRAAGDQQSYTSLGGTLITVVKHQESPVSEGAITLSAQSLKCGEKEIPLEAISDMAMHGRRALVFTAEKTYYELVPSEEANALKFLWLYEAYKNQL